MNATSNSSLPGWLPYVAGALLVVQFAGLGAWQVSRGLEKRATIELFGDEARFGVWSPGTEVRPYQRLQVSGHFDGDHQFLLDNIIVDGRIGYYVITPFELTDSEEPLLVNRGWLPRSGPEFDTDIVRVSQERMTVHGRAGSLPRAGYRMGEPILPDSAWPKVAVYPSAGDIASALGAGVQPFVLLLDPQEGHGYFRQWVPEEMGPGRHFAYALQWFAMGAALSALLVWNFRRGRIDRDAATGR